MGAPECRRPVQPPDRRAHLGDGVRCAPVVLGEGEILSLRDADGGVREELAEVVEAALQEPAGSLDEAASAAATYVTRACAKRRERGDQNDQDDRSCDVDPRRDATATAGAGGRCGRRGGGRGARRRRGRASEQRVDRGDRAGRAALALGEPRAPGRDACRTRSAMRPARSPAVRRSSSRRASAVRAGVARPWSPGASGGGTARIATRTTRFFAAARAIAALTCVRSALVTFAAGASYWDAVRRRAVICASVGAAASAAGAAASRAAASSATARTRPSMEGRLRRAADDSCANRRFHVPSG